MTLGFHYRTPRFDVGFIAGGLGSGAVRGQLVDRSAGHKFRFAPTLRWRYIDGLWGSLFVSVSPGLAIVDHTNAMRSEVAVAQGNPRDRIQSVPETTLAFHLATSLGIAVNVGDAFVLTLAMEIATSWAEMQDGTAGVRYTAVQPVLAIGFEAKL